MQVSSLEERVAELRRVLQDTESALLANTVIRAPEKGKFAAAARYWCVRP
jgi:DNA-binding winged helix-turn-helix (wHTH) protein